MEVHYITFGNADGLEKLIPWVPLFHVVQTELPI